MHRRTQTWPAQAVVLPDGQQVTRHVREARTPAPQWAPHRQAVFIRHGHVRLAGHVVLVRAEQDMTLPTAWRLPLRWRVVTNPLDSHAQLA